MASKKKSAIQSRQGHPTGIIDDIVRPIIQNTAKAVKNKAASKPANKLRAKAYYAAKDVERKVAGKRAISYRDKANSLYEKELKLFNQGTPLSTKKIVRSSGKRGVLGQKAIALEVGGYWGGPRQRAKMARKQNKVEQKVAEKIATYGKKKPVRKVAAVKPKPINKRGAK
jgi:hypothetical protein